MTIAITLTAKNRTIKASSVFSPTSPKPLGPAQCPSCRFGGAIWGVSSVLVYKILVILEPEPAHYELALLLILNHEQEFEWRYIFVTYHFRLTFPGDYRHYRFRNGQNRYVGLCDAPL